MKLTKAQENLLIYLLESKKEIIIKKKIMTGKINYVLNGRELDHYKCKIVDNLIDKKLLILQESKIILNFNNLFLRNFYQKFLISNSNFYSKVFSRKELYNYLKENNLIDYRGDTDFHYINMDDLCRDYQGKYYVCLFNNSELCGISLIEDYRDCGYYMKYNNYYITCISTLSIKNTLKGKGLSKYLLAHTFKNIPNSKIVYITDLSIEAQEVSLNKTIQKICTNRLLNNMRNMKNIEKIKIKD